MLCFFLPDVGEYMSLTKGAKAVSSTVWGLEEVKKTGPARILSLEKIKQNPM